MAIATINPTTGETVRRFDALGDADIEAALTRAETAFRVWRNSPITARQDALMGAAGQLEARKGMLAEMMTLEMGKPIGQAAAEVEKCAMACRHYAEQGPDYLADEPLKADTGSAFVRHLALGPVLAVMPWNFPLWQVFRFAAPAIMAGNVGLLKHASNVPQCALAIEEIFKEGGLPEGCFQTLLIGSGPVEKIIRDPRVRAVTLTGSGPAGAAVASAAGSEIKPSLLELGGTDAFIVMPSTDLDAAVATAVKARTQNNGQSCIAAKRFFVHRDIYGDFRDRFVTAFDELKVGDPTEDSTDIGPLAMESLKEDLKKQVAESLHHGATRLTMPRELPDCGWFVCPDILEGAVEDAPAFKEELFGPVAALWPVDSLEDAIARANVPDLGLGSALFSREPAEIDLAINGLEAGATFVNAMVASDPAMPFGGVKQSGYGRELYRDGIHAFMNRKTVRIAGLDQ